VLHARHATFYIFYARFPNRYLRDIATYGSRYLHEVRDPQRIIIQQSRPFRMRFPEQQGEFFRLFAKLIYYLVSGHSHVFHLAKDESNPLYRNVTGYIVSPIFASLKIVATHIGVHSSQTICGIRRCSGGRGAIRPGTKFPRKLSPPSEDRFRLG